MLIPSALPASHPSWRHPAPIGSQLVDLLTKLQSALPDRYRLERELGQGGMATVYLATDTRHARRVALKVLRPELAATLGVERFLREITIAARLQHPHILPVHDSGEAGGFLYYVMPYIEGETLRERLKRERQLPLPDAVRILREVTDALAYAHAQGVVHRDIKPENILISGRHALVADFGVAKAVSEAADMGNLTTAGVALGTPAYMAPEQATADPSTDHRADLYALGVLGYEMLAGRPPFTAASAPLVLAAHLTEAPVPLPERRAGLPAELSDVLMRCLAKSPGDRPATADDVLTSLETLGVTSGGTTPAATRPLQAMRPAPVRPRRSWLAGGAIALALLLGAWFAVRARGTGAGVSSADRPRIAVLPPRFTGAPDRAYVAEGIADEVNNRLVSLGTVEVVGRASADRFRNSDKSMREIGAALGAPYILALRVTDEGAASGTTRVAAELLRSATEAQAWSASFTVKSAEDMFALQQQVAERTAAALGLSLSGDQRSQLAARPTRNAEAYDSYMRAREVYRRGGGADDYLRAVTLFETATRLDSTFAAAWAGAGTSHLMVYWFFADRTAARVARARQALDRAVALAPDDPATHFALGTFHYRASFDLDGAERELQLAVKGDNGNSDYLAELAYVQRRAGRFEEARQSLERALTIDPLNANLLGGLGQTQFLLGDLDASEVTMRRALSLQPFWMAQLQLIDIARARHDAVGARRLALEMLSLLGVDNILKSFPPALLDVASSQSPGERAALAEQVRPAPETLDTNRVLVLRAELLRWAGRDARSEYAAVLPRIEAQAARLPDDPVGWLNLAECLSALGRHDDALAAARHALATPQGQRDRYEGPLNFLSAATVAAAANKPSIAADWARLALSNPIGRSRLATLDNPDMRRLRALPEIQALLREQKASAPRT